MADQLTHIVEYRTEFPPPPPASMPNPVTAPVESPQLNEALTARNNFFRSIGIGQTVDVLV